MNRPGKPMSVVLASLLLAGLLLGALWIIQPNALGAAATGTANPTPVGYPVFDTPVPVTYPPLPTMVNIGETPGWITTEPTLTATPSLEGSVVYDALNKFSVTLSAGWFASTPMYLEPPATGVTVISNYDRQVAETRPENGVSAQISVSQLDVAKSFDEWVEEQRQAAMSPEYGAGIQAGPIQPKTLGIYQGVSYTADDQFDSPPRTILVIYLLSDDHRVIDINLLATDPSDFSEILKVLSTLTLSTQEMP